MILMGATINTEKFSKYFGDAPVITTPGQANEVVQFFLDELPSENIVTADALQKVMAQTAVLKFWLCETLPITRSVLNCRTMDNFVLLPPSMSATHSSSP
ncbi:hypothetical protein HPB49_012396 [Dermacentor silvarum]|uniref:Uncharacterized protein n=1 Tax=Dermacentor silvarum TaxID=543639 RepID=A0ACB8E0W6_DERSI|nr:hypothetical protein HPB49_012396 [Dermacentor silvarum]